MVFSSIRRDRKATAAVEFAFVSFPFFLMLFFTFEISIDLFQQQSLDAGLHLAVRQVQTGNAQNVSNGTTFINNYLCPQVNGFLSCSGLNVAIQKITQPTTTTTDFYNYTTGAIPMTGGTLNLSSYQSSSFCNAGPTQFILVTAIYLSNGVIGQFMPNLLTVSYNGSPVHATMSQVATVTEGFPQTTPGVGSTVAPAC